MVNILKISGFILEKLKDFFVIKGRILNQTSTDNEGFTTLKREGSNLDSIKKYATNP